MGCLTRRRNLQGALLVVLVSTTPSITKADPCTAPLPPPGKLFTGTVRYVGDGDGLCVGASTDPASWVEVRVADFYAPELNVPGGAAAKGTLTRLALGKSAVCRAQRRSYDRIVAVCQIDGRSVGDIMRAAGAPEGGSGRP